MLDIQTMAAVRKELGLGTWNMCVKLYAELNCHSPFSIRNKTFVYRQYCMPCFYIYLPGAFSVFIVLFFFSLVGEYCIPCTFHYLHLFKHISLTKGF